MASYFRYIRKYNQSSGLAVMASASRDGGRLVAVLERFGACSRRAVPRAAAARRPCVN